MQIRSVGIDLGKTTFHLVALGASGKVLVKKFSQKQLLAFTANMQTSLIGLEACSGAHFLGRALPPSATALPSAGGEISQPGWALFRVSIRQAARRSCWASVSAATSTYARS